MTRLDRLASIADRYAWTKVDEPYIWGGDDFAGRDCSGFAIEVLQGVGLFPHGKDATADGLFHRYQLTDNPARGCLALWGSNGRATHVAWVTDVPAPDCVLVLEAGGGGSKTLTREDAIKQNAFVRLRRVLGDGCRTDLLGYVDPFLVE